MGYYSHRAETCGLHVHVSRDGLGDVSLSKTKIETDSYVAVQLIEKEKALNLDSLKNG